MGVRPPADGPDREPDTVSFGIAALDARLEEANLTYPVEEEALVRSLGDPEIPYDPAGNTVSLSEALDRSHMSRFTSEQELLNALHPVFESYRQGAGGGIVAQLRSLLPF